MKPQTTQNQAVDNDCEDNCEVNIVYCIVLKLK